MAIFIAESNSGVGADVTTTSRATDKYTPQIIEAVKQAAGIRGVTR